MADNKVIYGLEKLYIAFKDADALTPTWEAPVALEGAVSWKPKPEGNESKFYADNGPYFVVTANNGYTGDLEVALIPPAILGRMLGMVEDANGMWVEVADALPEKFALMGELSGDQAKRKFIYWDCQASRPSKEEKTQGETIEPNPDVLSITVFPIEVDGVDIVKGQMDRSVANAATFDAFYDAVYVPEYLEAS